MLFTVAFRLSMYSYNGHSCCKQNGVYSSTNNVRSTSLITVWNLVSLYVVGSVNCGVVAEYLLTLMVLLYGEVFLTRECERQSGASWWTERRPHKDKLHIATNNRQRSQEIMSHGPIMFSDFTGFGSDFPFILTAVNIVINTVYTTSKSLQTAQHLPRLCTIVTAHFFKSPVYVSIFSGGCFFKQKYIWKSEK